MTLIYINVDNSNAFLDIFSIYIALISLKMFDVTSNLNRIRGFVYRLHFAVNFLYLFKHCYCIQVLGQGVGVDFTFAWDNNNNKNDKNPHINILKGTGGGDQG